MIKLEQSFQQFSNHNNVTIEIVVHSSINQLNDSNN